jgi:SSS family solute:Na+ symporter
VVGLSLFASNISSTTLVRLSSSAYATGISISNYEWMASIVLVSFAVFVIPYHLSARIYTIPEFLELRFRRACRTYFSGLTIIGHVFIDTAGTLFVGAVGVSHFIWQSLVILLLTAWMVWAYR